MANTISFPWQAFVVGTACSFSILVFVLVVVCVVFLGPIQYNPYNTDLVKIDGRKGQRSDSTCGRFSTGLDAVKKRNVDTSVQVVVLGDIGRSPRMQYHAISLARVGVRVDLIGFAESEAHPEIKENHLIRIVPLTLPPKLLQTKGSLFILFGPLKAIWQAVDLYHALGYRTEAAKFMLVQNPPSIPLLAVAQVICWLRNTKFVIDWHNFGWSVLALRLGKGHPLVIVAKWYERLFSRYADAHFAVTDAMSRYLSKTIGIQALALHDRPAQIFQPLNKPDRAAFLGRMEQTSQFAKELAKGSWKLVVSSTSWTADEDFSLLLDALVAYSKRLSNQKGLPKILAIITGKGPQKEHYIKRIKALNQDNLLTNVIITTAWLTSEDYALLLGSADLGISLHQSTSGVDLPMKVVDMFGAGLPVVGWSRFESWPELVKEDVNGKGFGSADELEKLFVELFLENGKRLEHLRRGALKEGDRRWDQEWEKVAHEKVFR